VCSGDDTNRNPVIPPVRRALVTSWIADPEGGRARGPVRSLGWWIEALVRPRRLFRERRGARRSGPGADVRRRRRRRLRARLDRLGAGVVPEIVVSVPVSAAILFLLVVVLVAPVGLHLTAAVATLSVILASVEFDDGIALRDRGGVSETVQVVAYASSPMALAGPPIPELRVVCGAYAAVLLLIGFRIVHGTTLLLRTLVAGFRPLFSGTASATASSPRFGP